MSCGAEVVLHNTALGGLIGSFLPWQLFREIEPVQKFLSALPGALSPPLLLNLVRQNHRPSSSADHLPSPTALQWTAFLTLFRHRTVHMLVIRLEGAPAHLLLSTLASLPPPFLPSLLLHRCIISAAFPSFPSFIAAISANIPAPVSLIAHLLCPTSAADWQAFAHALAAPHTHLHAVEARGSRLYSGFDAQSMQIRSAGIARLCLNDYNLRRSARAASGLLLEGSVLVELDLGFNYIESCDAVADALEGNVNLRILRLNDNLIGRDNPCASLVALLRRRSGGLEEVYVGNNGLSARVVLETAAAVCANPQMKLLDLGALDYSETEIALVRDAVAEKGAVAQEVRIDLYRTPAVVERGDAAQRRRRKAANAPLHRFAMDPMMPVEGR